MAAKKPAAPPPTTITSCTCSRSIIQETVDLLAQSNTTFEFYASRRNQRVDLFLLINLNESTTISLAQHTTAIIALGFLGQALFGARLIVQIFLSEKHRRVVSPVVFWQLSLAGSFLFLIYGIVRYDWVIISGQFVSYFIYVRNLQLTHAWQRFPILAQGVLLLLPVVAATSLFFYLPAAHSGEVVLWHPMRSEEHTSELQSREKLVCRLVLE